MNGIVARAHLQGPPLDAASLDAALAAMSHRIESAGWSAADGRAALGGTDAARARAPQGDAWRPPIVVAADARLDLSESLRRELELPPDAPAADWIAAAYLRFGDECVTRLHGEFAFALWDPTRRRLLCARDRFGIKPLYYVHVRRGQEPSQFACASEIGALLATGIVPVALNEARLVAHLETLIEPGPATFYESILRLPPAHRLVVDENSVHLEEWWSLVAPPLLRLRTRDEYEEAFRERLADAVTRRLQGAARPGSMLSGGLDSSSIVAFARRRLAATGRPPPVTISLVFASLPQQDERRYIEPVVAQGLVEPSYIDASAFDPVADALATSADSVEPLAGGNFCLNRAIYSRARQLGVDVLLDGTDGDTIVSHGTGRLAELFAGGRWRSLRRESREFATALGRSTTDVLRRFALDPVLRKLALRVPSLRALARRLRREPPGTASLLRPDVARRFGFDRDRFPDADPAASFDAYSTEQELHLRAVRSPMHAFVFEQFDRLAAASRIEPRYPMFDLPFVEFCLSLPASEKLSGGWTRRTMRAAMAPLLPWEVAWRRTKSDFSPAFMKSMRAYVAPGGDALEREWLSVLGGYVDPAALRSTLDGLRFHPTVHDGLSAWKVLTLYAWLKSRSNELRTRDSRW